MGRATFSGSFVLGAIAVAALTGCPRSTPSKPNPAGTGTAVERAVPKVQLPPGCDDALKRVFAKSPRPITVTAYVSRSLSLLESYADQLRGQLDRINVLAGDRMNLRVVEVTEADVGAAQKAGCAPEPFEEPGAEASATVHGYLCVAFDYGTGHDVLKFLPPDRFEGNAFWIANKVQELRVKVDNEKRKIGVLVGHGALKLSDPNLIPAALGKGTLQQIVEQNFGSIELKDIDLRGGDGEIDPSLDGLLVTQPSEDWNEKELRRIDAFVMKGKNLAVFASAVNVKPGEAAMLGELSTHGLEKLTGGYGIEMHKDVVIDFGRPVRVQVPVKKGAPLPVSLPQFISIEPDPMFADDKALIDSTFTPFFKLERLAVPFASSLTVHPEKQPNAKIRIVMRSTNHALAQTASPVDLSAFQEWKPKGEFAQYPIAAVVEGKLNSAFSPDEPAKEGARVFVLSSSQFLANPFARATTAKTPVDDKLVVLGGFYAKDTMTNTILAFKNTIDWLRNEDDLAKCVLTSVAPEQAPKSAH